MTTYRIGREYGEQTAVLRIEESGEGVEFTFMRGNSTSVRGIARRAGSEEFESEVVDAELLESIERSVSETPVDGLVERFTAETGLTEEESEVYVLRVLYGMAWSETVEYLKIPKNTVDDRFNRVRRKISEANTLASMPGLSQ